jgi:hypothetical protein
MIRVLIGDGSERIRENLRRRLDGASAASVCAMVDSGEQAV